MTIFSAKFEAREHNDLRWLSGKTVFVPAVAFAKWVSELCALFVARDCLRCHPNGIGVSMWSNLSTFYVNQPLNLTTFTPESGVK